MPIKKNYYLYGFLKVTILFKMSFFLSDALNEHDVVKDTSKDLWNDDEQLATFTYTYIMVGPVKNRFSVKPVNTSGLTLFSTGIFFGAGFEF